MWIKNWIIILQFKIIKRICTTLQNKIISINYRKHLLLEKLVITQARNDGRHSEEIEIPKEILGRSDISCIMVSENIHVYHDETWNKSSLKSEKIVFRRNVTDTYQNIRGSWFFPGIWSILIELELTETKMLLDTSNKYKENYLRLLITVILKSLVKCSFPTTSQSMLLTASCAMEITLFVHLSLQKRFIFMTVMKFKGL